MSLASAFESSGLAASIGRGAVAFAGWPDALLVVAVTATVVLLSELASNTATAALFLPVAGAVSAGTGHDPLFLVLPATLAASCGFMLPVATPPNAIAYGSGRIAMPQMVRAGLLLDVLLVVLVTAAAFLVAPAVFGSP